jgi:hypothetical protein
MAQIKFLYAMVFFFLTAYHSHRLTTSPCYNSTQQGSLPHLVSDLYALHMLVSAYYQDFAGALPLHKLADIISIIAKATNIQVKQKLPLLEVGRKRDDGD